MSCCGNESMMGGECVDIFSAPVLSGPVLAGTKMWINENGTMKQMDVPTPGAPINVLGEESGSTAISLAPSETLNVKLSTNPAHTKPYTDGATRELRIPQIQYDLTGFIDNYTVVPTLLDNSNKSYSDGVHWFWDKTIPLGNIPAPPYAAPSGKKWVAQINARNNIDFNGSVPEELSISGGLNVNNSFSVIGGVSDGISDTKVMSANKTHNVSSCTSYLWDINQSGTSVVSSRFIINDFGTATLNHTFNFQAGHIDYTLFLTNV